MASGGRTGGGVSGGRARGPDPQGDLKNCPGPAAAGGAWVAEGEPDTARRCGEAAGAGGSGAAGLGNAADSPRPAAHVLRPRARAPGSRRAPGRRGGQCARAARGGIRVRPGEALRGSSSSSSWHPGAPELGPRASIDGGGKRPCAAQLQPHTGLPWRNAASPGLTAGVVLSFSLGTRSSVGVVSGTPGWFAETG